MTPRASVPGAAIEARRCLGTIAAGAPECIHTPYWRSIERALEHQGARIKRVQAPQIPTIEALRIEVIDADGTATVLIPARAWPASERNDRTQPARAIRLHVHRATGTTETIAVDIAIAAHPEDDVACATVLRSAECTIDHQALAELLHHAFAENYAELAQACDWDADDHAMHARIAALRHLGSDTPATMIEVLRILTERHLERAAANGAGHRYRIELGHGRTTISHIAGANAPGTAAQRTAAPG